MSSAYEPQPQWGCPHNWLPVGLPFVFWSSGNAGDPPPGNAPTKQKQYCTVCGGYEWAYL